MYYDWNKEIAENREYYFTIGKIGLGRDFEMKKRNKKQYYTFEFEMYERDMSYKLKSFSTLDSPIKAFIIAMSYIEEIEEMYETCVNVIDIYDESGRREYTVLL